jgi:hypothetical protein
VYNTARAARGIAYNTTRGIAYNTATSGIAYRTARTLIRGIVWDTAKVIRGIVYSTASRLLKKGARRELLSVIHYLRQDSEMARARWRH